ncbi:MAG: hypothetical protein WCO57_02590 [Verrucomicrobiota bacterium]
MKGRPKNKSSYVFENPPDQRNQRETSKLLKMLDTIKPATETSSRERKT